MMKHKKLIWLLVGLLSLCIVFSACKKAENVTEPSETVTEAPEQTQATEPEETQATEPVETEEVTEPEETEEVTEPEETQASGGATGSENTGTGGSYDPNGSTGDTPSDTPATQEIQVPAAGSEKNPYYENIPDGAGKFTTVKIPAGATVYYRIQTAGVQLRLEGGDIAVTLGEATYQPVDGVVEIPLAADDSAPMAMTFTNNAQEDQSFGVEIVGAPGSRNNPYPVEDPENIPVSLEEGDTDGVFYSWVADSDGMLKLWSEQDIQLNVFVNDEAQQLTEDNGGKLCVQVKNEDEILIQAVAQPDAEGNLPAAEAQLHSYIAQQLQLTVRMVPYTAEAVTVEAGKSVYFTVTGIQDKLLQLAAENTQVYCGEDILEPVDGVITIPTDENTVSFEVCNLGAAQAEYVLTANYPLGHMLNPHILESLGEELVTTLTAKNGAYYYRYTAVGAGFVSFQISVPSENANAFTDITVSNTVTEETVVLSETEDQIATVAVKTGQMVQICVTVRNILGADLDDTITVMSNHFGIQSNPIVVAYPGFTAQVPAGETLYYQSFNMNGMEFALTGTDVTVEHNANEYSGENIAFDIVSQGREPAVFAITNHSAADASYQAVFTYPIGWMENPAPLALGTNTLTQEAGKDLYYYSFTAPRAGKLILTFDPNENWTYVVNNMTQFEYGDTQWSDSDPLVSTVTLEVSKNDEIQLAVNTYDPNNMFAAPAGTVEFEAQYISGPVNITDLTRVVNTPMIPGEYAAFTGQFYGSILTVAGSADAVVYFNGTAYTPDSAKQIKVTFPETGEGDMEFLVYNAGTANITCSCSFSTTQVGSEGNPDTLKIGTNTVVQDVLDGDFYYYTFTADTRGTLTLTFSGDNVDCIYLINNSVLQNTYTGRDTYRITVRAGQTVTIAVNTYDGANPTVFPLGTVVVTAEFK